MAKTSTIFARVQPEVKQEAEEVLTRLGIPMSNAIDMFLRQVALQKGIPFEVKLPKEYKPVSFDSLTEEVFESEINKGLKDIHEGRVHSANEVDEMLKKNFGI